MNKQSNNFEVLELAKEAFKHLPEPDNGWYVRYGYNPMTDRRPIIAASNLGRWFMMVSGATTFGGVCSFLARHYRTTEEPHDHKLKDYIIACWGEQNHSKIEYESDYRLRKLLQQHYHQNLEPGQSDYWKEYATWNL